MLPAPGQIVRARSRQYLVQDAVAPPAPHDDTLVRLSCSTTTPRGSRRAGPSGTRRLRNAALRETTGKPCAGNPHARFGGVGPSTPGFTVGQEKVGSTNTRPQQRWPAVQ